MEVIAQAKSIRISPRKARLVADSIRKLSLENALVALEMIDKRGAYPIKKILNSAIANATNNANLSKDNLIIKSIDVFDGPGLRRMRASTRGRPRYYKRRSSNIKIILEEKIIEKKPEEVIKIAKPINNETEKIKDGK